MTFLNDALKCRWAAATCFFTYLSFPHMVPLRTLRSSAVVREADSTAYVGFFRSEHGNLLPTHPACPFKFKGREENGDDLLPTHF